LGQPEIVTNCWPVSSLPTYYDSQPLTDNLKEKNHSNSTAGLQAEAKSLNALFFIYSNQTHPSLKRIQ